MIAWVADAVPVSPTSVFQIRCSLSVSVPKEAGGVGGGGDTGGGVGLPMVLLVVILEAPNLIFLRNGLLHLQSLYFRFS
jgi:hypothetical protein